MFRKLLMRGVRKISPKLSAKLTPKPILRSSPEYNYYRGMQWVKKKKQSHYRPGFVYIFQDYQAIRGEGVTMCKIGLSRTTKRRRYFLSLEYQSNLEIKAIVPTFNMRLTEVLTHQIFKKHNVLRKQRLDVY
jgi:hypothetical protein